MKQVFSLVFGGLAAVALGIGLAYGAGILWKSVSPSFARFGIRGADSVASIGTLGVTKVSSDGTTISGFSRTIRYTADEEEDLLSSAARALPAGADSRITASAYIVRNLATGEVVVEHDADRIMPIASLTKLVTAVVAKKLLDPNERITLSRSIMATYGNTAGFRAGETFRAEDLYYPLLIVSSNDAAEALATEYGRKKFIQAMNDFAQSIGAYRTYFDDPSGLSRNNVSSAKDVALILDWVRRSEPDLMAITLMKTKTVRGHTWVNPTHFLNWSTYLGGKNGYTPEADRTGAALFALGLHKEPHAVIVLGSSKRDADVIKLLSRVSAEATKSARK